MIEELETIGPYDLEIFGQYKCSDFLRGLHVFAPDKNRKSRFFLTIFPICPVKTKKKYGNPYVWSYFTGCVAFKLPRATQKPLGATCGPQVENGFING